MQVSIRDSLSVLNLQREEIRANCDACGGERSRQLLDLLLKAKVAAFTTISYSHFIF